MQLQAAKYLYSHVLGLRFPLEQKIYAQARQINVYVLQLPKGNGLAFDRVAAETMNDGRQLPCGLKFVLNAALEPARNITLLMNFSIFISMAMPSLNKHGIWRAWRGGWKTALKPRRKYPAALSAS